MDKRQEVAVDRASRAVREATRRRVDQHRRLGLPIAVERDGVVVWLSPDEVEVPPPQGPAGLLYVLQARSAEPARVRAWLSGECPNLADLLNLEVLPPGLLAYLSPRSSTEMAPHGLDHTAAENLLLAEQQFSVLHKMSPEELPKLVKRLRKADTEDQLVEILCEAAVCSALARVAQEGSLVLSPATRGGSSCDLRARIGETDLWGEIKRYSDGTGQSGAPLGRALSVEGHRRSRAEGVSRSRAEGLRSKLDGWSERGQGKGVPDQFLPGHVNVLFLFEDAWSPLPHVRAALWGDRYYFDDPPPGFVPEEGPGAGLFARERWRIVSACCWMTTTMQGAACTQGLWCNPKADVALPEDLETTLLDL